MKDWKKILILCGIVFVIGIIIETIWKSNDLIWNIGKEIVIISIVVGIVTLLIGMYLTYKEYKKENKTIPMWFNIVISIVILFVIIFIFGNYYTNKFSQTYNEQYNQIME